MAPVVGTGLKPLPLRATVLVFVKVVPGLETVADPGNELALVGQNRTSTLAPCPLETEKLLPDEMLKGGLGPALTVPDAGPVP